MRPTTTMLRWAARVWSLLYRPLLFAIHSAIGSFGCGLARDFAIEFFCIDDNSFVRALGDLIHAVMRRNRKSQLAAFHLVQIHVHRDRQSGRGGGQVREVDVRAERLLTRPVQMRIDGFDAGPFEQADQITCRHHLRHLLKSRGFRVEMRHRFIGRYGVYELVPQSGLQRVFHG